MKVRDFRAADLQWLVLQNAQRLWLGLQTPELDLNYGRQLEMAGPAWTVTGTDGWIVAACGYHEIFPTYATAWSLLAEGVGAQQLGLTRLVRRRLDAAPYNRVEALIRADFPPAARWARMLGFAERALVERAGPQDEDYILFDRVRPREPGEVAA